MEGKEVEVYTYIFPDNDGSGNLENLLIDTAKIVYPQLLDFAEEYVGKAATIQTTLMREQDKNKAIVGWHYECNETRKSESGFNCRQ